MNSRTTIKDATAFRSMGIEAGQVKDNNSMAEEAIDYKQLGKSKVSSK